MTSFPIQPFCDPARTHRRLLTEVSPGHYELCIDNTTLEALLTCPRRFEIYSVLGRDSGERDALNYGSNLHKALECHYKGGTLEDCVKALREGFREQPSAPDSWRNFDHALAALEQYVNWRKQMTMCVWEPIELEYESFGGCLTKPAVEVPFKIELASYKNVIIAYPYALIATNSKGFDPAGAAGLVCGQLDTYWTGKIDLLIEQQGRRKVLDHKTSSMGGDTFWGTFKLSSQMRGYCWAASELLGEPVRDAIIDVLFGRAPTAKGKGIPHENEMREFSYTDEQIKSWHTDVIDHIETLLSRLSKGYFPEANVWCYNKYGKCPYFDACHISKTGGTQLLLSGQYKERTWNPLTA